MVQEMELRSRSEKRHYTCTYWDGETWITCVCKKGKPTSGEVSKRLIPNKLSPTQHPRLDTPIITPLPSTNGYGGPANKIRATFRTQRGTYVRIMPSLEQKVKLCTY